VEEGAKEVDAATIASAKQLSIEVIEGPSIKTGTILKINAGGLIGTKRMIRDGCAYFGTDSGQVMFSS